ncbi:MAG: ABC transporter ATP-binding protein [Bacteroidota bacterium]
MDQITRAPVLSVRRLTTRYASRSGTLYPVRDVSFELKAGETLGVVGESGSGKTALGLSLIRLLPHAGRIESGEVVLDGENILKRGERDMCAIRGAKIALIPQDPMASLNPLFRIGAQVSETLAAHSIVEKNRLAAEALSLLQKVNIPHASRRLRSYPHELSGGMRQRVVGAIAIACVPSVLIADEPTTALDVTIQAQYLALLERLREETGVGMILITHDLGVVAQLCDRVAVMYAGYIVEQGSIERIFDRPAHPYTAALLATRLGSDAADGELPSIPGQPPDLRRLPQGCPFAPRCSRTTDQCRQHMPQDTTAARGGTVRYFHPLQ